jgi:glucose/arabinose dehydrogenase
VIVPVRPTSSARRSRPLAIAFGAILAIAVPVLPAISAARSASTATRTTGVGSALDTPRVVTPAVAPAAAAFDPAKVALHLTVLTGNISRPVLVTNAGDGSGRLFVVEKTGKIRIITKAGALLSTPFIDFSSSISNGSEQGLLGLAFHPHYETNGYFYVNFTDRSGTTIINRYKAAPGANSASHSSAVRILSISQPYANHNGGNLAFGPDGYLYVGMGDGGSGGDPGNRAQSLNTLLGKMLRIDVDHWATGKHYSSPASNPYVGKYGLDEIWSIGLRNPWRWSFDWLSNRLWIADVGQDRYEEVDRSAVSGSFTTGRGANYGWRVLEGRACYNPPTGCSTAGKQPPLVVYSHSVSGTDNCSITGGHVYRGTKYPVLAGGYLYGDFCSGRIWVVSAGALTPATGTLLRDAGVSPALNISSFGEDEAGELYVCDLNGRIYRISASVK